MSVRFVLGRAGAGKTHYCLEQIAARLRESPEGEPRLVLLVPEQAGMQMERSLLEWPGVEGFARCEVLSFRRLAHRVLSACGGAKTVSDTGRLMIIRRLLSRHADELNVFGGSRGRRGLVDRIGRTLDELAREEVTPDDLAEARRQADRDDDLLAMRLHDIELLYRAYIDRLGDEFTDPSQHLDIVRRNLDDYPPLSGALIWVDGFAGLTKQEHRLLVALADRSQRMEITLLMDHGGRESLARGPVESFHLFARTERTYVGMTQALTEAGVEVDEPLILDGPNPRFSASPELAVIERELFLPAPTPGRHRPTTEATGDIRLIQAATRRVEIAAAVTEIQRLVRNPDAPLRYRDIAVIVRNLDPYHDLLTAALSAAGIPHFIDRRRPIAHHAVVEFVRSAIDLAGMVDIEAVSTFIKTGLAGLGDDDADLLENYLRSHGVTGRWRWLGDDWTYQLRPSRRTGGNDPAESATDELSRLNGMRTDLAAALGPWWQLADASEPQQAGQWARGLFELIERFEVSRQIADWADQADKLKRLDEAAEHRQVWSHLVDLLDDLSETFADEPMSLSELAEIIDTALAGSTLGLTPPTLDQVLVGSIERSRHPTIRAALVLGFSEGTFPRRPAEDPIFSDRQRTDLAKAGVELAPTSRQQLFDEKLLAYIALTRPNEQLRISWPAAEQDGRACRPSPYIDTILAAIPGLTIIDLPDPTSARLTWPITTVDDLTAAVTADFRIRTSQPTRSREDDRRWDALYEWARNDDATRDRLGASLASLACANDASLPGDVVGRLRGDTLETSVSRIETFAACPFRYFAKYGLALETRDEFELDALDLGSLYHRILEDHVTQLIRTGSRLDDVPLDKLGSLVRDLSRKALGEMVDELITSDARTAYIVEHGNADLVRSLEAQRFVAEAGEYRPVAAEVTFGLDKPGDTHGNAPKGQIRLPGLAVTTPQGRTALLRGKIDRVDLAELAGRVLATVVDYKSTSRKRLKLDRVYHGLDLQLLTYLLVLSEHGDRIAGGNVKPAGAFYTSLRDELRRVDGPPESPPDPGDRYHELRPRGVFDFDAMATFDRELDAGASSSRVISARVKRDGSPGNIDSTDVAEHQAFEDLLDHVRRRIATLCDRLLDGVIAVDPYRLGPEKPCTYCPYQSVCRFEFDAHRPRRLATMKRQMVFQAVDRLAKEDGNA